MSARTSGPEGFKAFEAEGWERRAGTYGEMLGTMTARVAGPLLDAAGVRHDIEAHRHEDGLELPTVVKLASGRR